MPQDDICPKCKQPRQDSESGSLTDWISMCRCNILSREEELFLSLQFCQNCQKRISDARHGSLTQWIFRADLCSCEKPLSAKHAPEDHDALAQPAWKTVELPELENIDVDFPIDQFKPVEEIGRGSTGVVFRCQDRMLQNIVAIKILQNFDSEQIVSFQKEAKITALLKHENIIQIRDIGIANESTPYMVLEYLAGLNLSDYISQKGPLNWSVVVSLAKQICSAIEYAHAQNIFHRDITPRNILLTKDTSGELLVRVIDFGLAAFQRGTENKNEFQGHTLAGTPGYLCPDQAAGLSYDASCDIYSIGCVIYESLAGEALFKGNTAMEMLNNQISTSSDTAIESLDVPETVQTVLKKCLAHERTDRYRFASELFEDLSLCLQDDDDGEDGGENSYTNEHSRLTKVIAASLLVVSLGLFGSVAWMVNSYNTKSQPSSPTNRNEVDQPISGLIPAKQMGRVIEIAPGSLRTYALSDDETLKVIQNREDVTSLTLSGSMITGSGFKYLVNLPIQHINLNNTPITNDSISDLFKIKSIRTVNVSSTGVTGVNFDKFQSLRHLDMRKTKMNDAGAESISRIKTLKQLAFTGEFLTRRGIESLSKAEKLNQLDILGDSLSSKDLEPIKQMKNLEILRFKDRTLSKEDILFANSESIKDFYCLNTKLKHPSLHKYFTQLKNLKKLDLGIPSMSASDLNMIGASLPNCVVRNLSADVLRKAKKTEAEKSGLDSLVFDVGNPEQE